MSVTKESVDRLMKRCQIGCGGRQALDDAHDILAECYGTLGALVQDRDALRARIDGAQRGRVSDVDGFVTICHPIAPGDTWPDSLWGRRVALVPLDD